MHIIVRTYTQFEKYFKERIRKSKHGNTQLHKNANNLMVIFYIQLDNNFYNFAHRYPIKLIDTR